MQNTTEKQVFNEKNLQIEKDNLYKIVHNFFSIRRSNDYLPILNDMALAFVEQENKKTDFELGSYFEIVNLIISIENSYLNSKEMT
jgi:hypothetical protein